MSQLMPGEFLPQLSRLIGKGRQDVLTRPPSWHWTGHSVGYWQQAELRTEMVQAEQW